MGKEVGVNDGGRDACSRVVGLFVIVGTAVAVGFEVTLGAGLGGGETDGVDDGAVVWVGDDVGTPDGSASLFFTVNAETECRLVQAAQA